MEADKPYMIRCTSCRAKNRIPGDKVQANPVCGKCRTPLNISEAFTGRSVEVSGQNFESAVLRSEIPVLLLFWAPWCSACQSVLPVMDRIAANMRGRIKAAKVNIQNNPDLASRYDVMSVPQLFVFDNGVEKENIVGALSELDILKKIAPYY